MLALFTAAKNKQSRITIVHPSDIASFDGSQLSLPSRLPDS